MKLTTFIVIIMTTTNIFADVISNYGSISNIKPWIAISTLWGQGNAGAIVKQKANKHYGLSYNFVSDWSEFDFTYHEVALFTSYDRSKIGMKYRHQRSQTEWTPYVSYFISSNKALPVSLYNELEYRHNSIVKSNDYVRTRHIASIYVPKWIENKIYIRPYAALDFYMDWDDVRYEKMRLNIGYFLKIERTSLRVYFLPWSKGKKEESWNDKNTIGASLIYNF